MKMSGFENIVIMNESDGLSISRVVVGCDKENEGNGKDFPSIPKSLIVTGFEVQFFEDGDLRSEFETVFRTWGACTFNYFKSFKRVRVNYESSESCVLAREQGQGLKVGESTVNVYFAIGQQVKSDNSRKSVDGFLQPPIPEKQFLISPPGSPPRGWEPRPEEQPCKLNLDLISALSLLAPGESQELFKPVTAAHPSIVVHIAAAPVERPLFEHGLKIIENTKRPPTVGM